jgi:hypothetical protein
MQYHSARYTINPSRPSARRLAGNFIGTLLFWLMMLGLISSPIWLPFVVELMVP